MPARSNLFLCAALAATQLAWKVPPRPAAADKAESAPAVAAARGPTFPFPDGRLTLEICAPNIVRVVFSPAADFAARPTLATAPKQCAATPWRTSTEGRIATVTTSELKVRVDLSSGAVQFRDLSDRLILAERPNGRTLAPAEVQGERTFHVRQQWEPHPDESLHGLGQHQQGLVDLKDHDLELRQYNTEIYIPFLVSSRGYGILWDNTSYSRFGDLGDAVPLPVSGLYATGGRRAGDVAIPMTTTSNGAVDWSGTVTPPVTGDYLFRVYSAGEINLTVDGKPVIDHWRQGWLPNEDVARVRLTAGRPAALRLRWKRDIGVNILRLLWKPPLGDRPTSLWSEVGDGVDYTFVYGPELDRVVAGYRALTGEAPMPPRWAFGLWQCRERYTTQKESLDVLGGFRARGLPVDAIVQDWRYWPEGTWGSHAFDAKRFPDPGAWIREIHQKLHAHLMISVWPKFYTGTENFAALDAAGFLYRLNLTERKVDFLGHQFSYYDAFHPDARRAYWGQIEQALASKGVDAWWMDAPEPEVVEGPFDSAAAQVETNRTHMHPTALGTGARMLNAYSLMNSHAVFDGLRARDPDARVFILTRSGFAGQQRTGAASWSGDISSTWTAMAKQIPAGLGYSVSGLPYWTLDSGGFSVPARFTSAARGSAALDEWRELNARWFQYATFLPLLRLHGQSPKREPWEFGGDGSPAYEAIKTFDRLRYRLLPYTYSLAGDVTQRGGTILRPLVMDFRGDSRARGVADQFMFGPALLVSPVTTYQARARAVVLPATRGGWYDFWTGAPMAGGGGGGAPTTIVQAPAPYDRIPVHVRAGSIVPFGPELQYTGEKPADPITVFVYAGAPGAFSLYEDDGISMAYARGAFSRIPLNWNDATRTLTIGAREGTYVAQPSTRTFQIVEVRPGQAIGFSFTPKIARTISYSGQPVAVTLR